MKEFVIIVAGGSGKRMGATIPKQYLLLLGKPLIFHTLEKFYSYNNKISIVVVLPAESINNWKNLCEEYNFNLLHQTVAGGSERFYSVQKGLSLVPENCLVAIHDAVRPGVSRATIESGFITAFGKGNAIPVVPLVDSLRKVDGDKSVVIDRNNLVAVQTPQCFKSEIIKKAYQQKFSPAFTDDASVLESIGFSINLTEGNRENIKITVAEDLAYLESTLRDFDKAQ